jgi:cytochrome b6-f complex iron-sulfur subunit
MNRRDLIEKVLLGSTVLVVVPSLLQSCTKPAADQGNNTGGIIPGTKINLDLSAPENSTLNTTGGSRVVQGVLVVNTGGGVYIAVASACTHAGCTVGYNAPAGNILCPCHGSAFTTTGAIVNGPAATPLQSFPVSKSGNVITISL